MNERSVILWGCGNGGAYAYEHLKTKADIIAFADKNDTKIGREYMGKPIVSAEQIKAEYPDAVILNTVMSIPHDLLVEELRQKEIYNEIYKYTEFLDSDSIECRRDECAEFHETCMEQYFKNAEDENNLNVFWGESSPFRKMFAQLDTSNIVELACGRGRHVPWYMNKAETIILIDILEKNIELCKERFKNIDKISCYVNSGCDMTMVGDNSASAVFSYDSMVHFESIDVFHYLQETYRVLKPGGMALYHHSNNDKDYKATFLSGESGRNYMSMSLFAHFADRAGLRVVEQVEVPWGKNLIDGITLLIKD